MDGLHRVGAHVEVSRILYVDVQPVALHAADGSEHRAAFFEIDLITDLDSRHDDLHTDS
jgi:hypothetical protein